MNDSKHIFNYFEDIIITFGNEEFSVEQLLVMSDKEFDIQYKNYEKHTQIKIDNTTNTKDKNGFEFIEITGLIDMVERVRLERRINKLEKNIG